MYGSKTGRLVRSGGTRRNKKVERLASAASLTLLPVLRPHIPTPDVPASELPAARERRGIQGGRRQIRGRHQQPSSTPRDRAVPWAIVQLPRCTYMRRFALQSVMPDRRCTRQQSQRSRERLCRSVTHVLSLNSEGFLQGLFVPKPTAFENELNASWRVRAQMWRVERTRQHTQPLTERFLARARRLFFAAWTPAFPTYHSL